MINSFLNTYFGFNKQQRNGLFVLILISFCLFVIRLVYPHFIKPNNIVLQNLPLIERKLDSAYSAEKFFSKTSFDIKNKPLQLFVFDPNTVSLTQLIQLGFKEKTAQILLKFRKKGFIFKEKEDLKKVYGVSDKLFYTLQPYILIRKGKAEVPQNEPSKKINLVAEKPTPQKLELNTVDSLSLITVSGIGPSFAKRILKYRSILGGYVSIVQLNEVYGFSEELYEKVKTQFYIDAHFIKKINLNKDDFKVINKHPYLSYEMCGTIFDWRRKTTITATNLKEILNDASLYAKLLPYLSFDQ